MKSRKINKTAQKLYQGNWQKEMSSGTHEFLQLKFRYSLYSVETHTNKQNSTRIISGELARRNEFRWVVGQVVYVSGDGEGH